MKLLKPFFAAILLFVIQINAQNLPQIQVSPHARVFQEVGLSDITIDYHRPAVKGREIWGKLVPYGMTNLGFGTAKESPWRAGANENTTITFTDDVKINGKSLTAGTYGLHMIVNPNDWTIIFNKNHDAWGSFFYDAKDDALRITAAPEKSEFIEWLEYNFENLTDHSTDVELRWENQKVKFTCAFDMINIVIDRYRKSLVGAAGFNAVNFQQAAAFCIQNNINLKEAEMWLDHSIALRETGMNLLTKSQLLAKQNKQNEAEEFEKKAFKIATEGELNTYGYTLMTQYNNIDKAIEIFKINVEKHPESWNVFDSLAEAYAKKGDKNDAVKYYNMALDKSPENQHERIKTAISNLN